MEEKLSAICIPSGSRDETDLDRGHVAINYWKNSGENIPIQILGVGTDFNSVFGSSEPKENPDCHKELYNLLLNKTKNIIGLDINSRTSVENILYGFPYGQEGVYGIVTEDWHFSKFELILKKLRKKGKVSENLELAHIPVENTNYYNLFRKKLSFFKTKLELRKL